MKRTLLWGYLVLLHLALIGVAAAIVTGHLVRPNPSYGLRMVSQRVGNSELKDVQLSDLMPGWGNDGCFHYLQRDGKTIVEITEFRDGIANIGIEMGHRGQYWIFPTEKHSPTTAPRVSVSRRQIPSDAEASPGRVIDSLMDMDGDGLLETKVIRPTDPNARPERWRLKSDAWELCPWPDAKP